MKKFYKILFLYVIEFAIIFTVGSIMNWTLTGGFDLPGLIISAATSGLIIAVASSMFLIDMDGNWRVR